MINSYQLKRARIGQHLRCGIKWSFIFAPIGVRGIIWADWFVEPSFFLVSIRPLILLLELSVSRIDIISKNFKLEENSKVEYQLTRSIYTNLQLRRETLL